MIKVDSLSGGVVKVKVLVLCFGRRCCDCALLLCYVCVIYKTRIVVYFLYI